MATTIPVVLVNTQSDDPVSELQVLEGTTVEAFLAGNSVKTDNATVTLRLDGQDIPYGLGDELESNTRVTVTPTNVKGA